MCRTTRVAEESLAFTRRSRNFCTALLGSTIRAGVVLPPLQQQASDGVCASANVLVGEYQRNGGGGRAPARPHTFSLSPGKSSLLPLSSLDTPPSPSVPSEGHPSPFPGISNEQAFCLPSPHHLSLAAAPQADCSCHACPLPIERLFAPLRPQPPAVSAGMVIRSDGLLKLQPQQGRGRGAIIRVQLRHSVCVQVVPGPQLS